MALRHHAARSDTRTSRIDCIIEMLWDLQRAYETKELLSYHSDLNILSTCRTNGNDVMRYIYEMCSVSDTDTWVNFISKMREY